jgi:adenosylcobinamide-GDP ribazoletransferase
MVPVAYGIGAVGALPVLALPGPTAAIAYPGVILGLTGIAHLDGLADLADASVVHGPPADRRAVMQDTVTGVGGTAAIGLSLLGLALAGLALANAPLPVAAGIVIAAEVGAKLAMVGLAALGTPAHEGMGSQLLGATATQFLVATVIAAPVALVAWPELPPLLAFVGSLIGGASVAGGASRRLGGVSGDVFGATNECARLVALHVGVVAWMHC